MSNNPIRDTPTVGQVVVQDGRLTPQLQSLLESIDLTLNTGKLNSYTVVNLPAASKFIDCLVVVTDEAGGRTTALSDGTNWRRSQDRVIVS